MGPLNFLNPVFVGAAAVAAVPIIIHLVQRRRIQQVVFGSVRFLRKMSHRVVRRRRFTELLLIVLRTFALAALAFAFARPFFSAAAPSRVGAETVTGDEAIVLLIDNSYSMSLDGRLAAAKKKAAALLEGLDSSIKVMVVGFSNELRTLAAFESSLNDAKAAVANLQQTWQGTDLNVALMQADQYLTGRKEAKHRVILISDLQNRAWQSAKGDKLAPGTVLEVHDVTLKDGQKGRDLPNLYVERVAVPRMVLADSVNQVVSAKVVNAGDVDAKNVPVTLSVGKNVDKRSLNVPARSEMVVHFRQDFKDPGDAGGVIALDYKDAGPADNNGYFSVHVTPRLRVLMVNGAPAKPLVSNDGFFLRYALTPPGTPSPFALREVAPQAFKPEDLKDADVVLVANADQVSPAASAALKQFVSRGGGVGFIVGDKVDPDEFNKSFGEISPARLWKTALDKGANPVVISAVDFKHEIFQPFDGPHNGDFAIAQIRQYFQVNPAQTAVALARFSSGHPALLERAGDPKLGAGRTLLYTSSMDMDWSDLCLKSIFVAYSQQMAKRLCAEQTSNARTIEVGQTQLQPVTADVKKAELRLPDGQKRTLEAQAVGIGAGATLAVKFTPEQPGLYELAMGNEVARYAVNLDPHEPDLSRLNEQVFRSAMQQSPTAQMLAGAGVPTLMGKSSARQRAEAQQALWLYLIGAVLAALAVEMVLAGRNPSMG
jgi:hypothetical protein